MMPLQIFAEILCKLIFSVGDNTRREQKFFLPVKYLSKIYKKHIIIPNHFCLNKITSNNKKLIIFLDF